QGNGTFGPRRDFATAAGPVSVAVGDFRGIGRLDLAVSTYTFTGGTVSVLLGNGDGTFRPRVDYAPSPGLGTVAAGALNGDGRLALAAATSAHGVSVLWGNGDGTFGPRVDYPAGAGPYAVAVGDFRGIGTPDLVVANYLGDSVSVLLGNG